MEYVNTVLSWLGSGITGSILGIVGIALAVLTSLYQHHLTHYSRQKYKKAVLRRLTLIDMYHTLKQDNLHNSFMMAAVFSAVFTVIFCCTMILILFTFVTNPILDTRTRGVCAIVGTIVMLYLTRRCLRSARDVLSHVSAVVSPASEVIEICAELKTSRASLLLKKDRWEINSLIVEVSKHIAGLGLRIEPGDLPPKKDDDKPVTIVESA